MPRLESLQETGEVTLPKLVAQQTFSNPETINLTVGIPAYKHAHYIEECLAGVLTSNRKEALEIIVIDDSSPDDTVAKAVQVLERTGANFRVYRNSSNQGLSFGLNFLLLAARGTHFMACASDDRILGPSLDRLMQKIALAGAPKTFEICAARYIGDKQGHVYDTAHLTRMAADVHAFCAWLSTEIPKPLLLQSTVFNTAFLKRVDPWRDQLILDDWPTFLRAGRFALANGLPIAFTPEIVLTEYRVHLGGLHSNAERQKRACLEVVEKVISEEFRPVARANVLTEFVTADLAQGRYAEAWRGYVAAIASHPTPATLWRAPVFVLRGVLRRITRKIGFR